MPRSFFGCLGFVLLVLAAAASAHEVRPAYLELSQTGPETYDVLWKVPARGEGMNLPVFVRFPDGTVETGERRGLHGEAAFTERWSVQRPAASPIRWSIFDGLGATLTDVLVRVERLDGTTLVSRVSPAEPQLLLASSPSLSSVAGTYLVLGVEHILFGIDHLLFVLALLLLVSGTRRLVGTITAFTVAHSITLATATLGFVTMPVAPVEAVIALSIVFVAAEILHGQRGQPGLAARAPWIVAFVFGLLHGVGFAGALHEVGLPDNAIPLALLLFNVGVEIGQLAFVAAVLTFLWVASRPLANAPRWGAALPAYAIGTMAMFWTLQRIGSLG